MNDEEEMIFLHINDNNDIEEDLIDEYEAEYIFLTEHMNVGVYNSDDDKDEDYNTESDSDNKSDNKDTDNAHDDESTGSEIPGVEIPGVDNNTQNINNHPTEIPGVDTEGVDNDNDGERRYMNMNLRVVSRIYYRVIHDGK